VERIAQAAVQVADADGIEALSMQRIAAELGCSTMSLYNHIPNKELLLEVAADVGAGAPPDLDDAKDFRHLTAVVRGTAQISMNMTSAHKTDDGIPRNDTDLAQIVAEFIDPKDYPALTAVHAAEIAGEHPGHERADEEALPFELSFGVDRFLDGVEGWVAAQTHRAGPNG
jgi:AcrR family transcriptional regulator